MEHLPALLDRALGFLAARTWSPSGEYSAWQWITHPWTLIMLGVAALEYCFPAHRKAFGKDNILTGWYFILAGKVAVFTIFVLPLIRGAWLRWDLPSLHLDRVLPGAVYAVLGILVISFCDYWAHRLLHRSPLLWHIHKIHHAPAHLNFATRFHEHFGMQIIHVPLVTSVMLLLGTDIVAPFGIVLITLDYFQHSNVSFRFGWLNYVFSTPEVHRFHHSTDPRHYDRNFGGSLIIWDILFGTYFFDADHPPEHYGLDEPIPQSYVMQQVMPLVWIARDVRARLRRPLASPALTPAVVAPPDALPVAAIADAVREPAP